MKPTPDLIPNNSLSLEPVLALRYFSIPLLKLSYVSIETCNSFKVKLISASFLIGVDFQLL